MSWVAAGVASAGLTLAAVKWVSGNSKEKKAKKARENLKAPFYDIQNEYYQNVNSANSLAQGGLPAATKDYFTSQSEKGLSSGIQAILGGGGSPNDVSKIFQTYEDSISKVAAADAETHINNIKYYMGVNKDLAGQKTIQWAINKQQPYLNTLKELSSAQKAGEATKNEAYGDALSSLSSFGTSMAGSGGFGKGSSSKATSSVGGSAVSGLFSGTNEGFSGKNTNTVDNINVPTVHSDIPDPFGDTHNEGDFQDYQNYLNWKKQRGRI